MYPLVKLNQEREAPGLWTTVRSTPSEKKVKVCVQSLNLLPLPLSEDQQLDGQSHGVVWRSFSEKSELVQQKESTEIDIWSFLAQKLAGHMTALQWHSHFNKVACIAHMQSASLLSCQHEIVIVTALNCQDLPHARSCYYDFIKIAFLTAV